MEIANNVLHFNAHLMAIVNCIKAYVEAGRRFPNNMTRDEAADQVFDVLGLFEELKSLVYMTIVYTDHFDHCPKIIRDVFKLVDTYLDGCRVGLEWPTCCPKCPFVPHLFRVNVYGKYTFDNQVFCEFVDSLPADAYLIPKPVRAVQSKLRRRRVLPLDALMAKSTDEAPTGAPTGCVVAHNATKDTSTAMLFFTLQNMIGLSKTDTHALLATAPLFKLSRENIKEIAQYVVKNPDTAVIDRLIVVASGRLGIDHEELMTGAAADGWTRNNIVQFLAEVAENGLPKVVPEVRAIGLE
ncbi:hypothetical protein GGF32_006491 [Allomyces javanicus]|nr:hypothetical protein GGF32_006491 [Allomyces javanicus]